MPLCLIPLGIASTLLFLLLCEHMFNSFLNESFKRVKERERAQCWERTAVCCCCWLAGLHTHTDNDDGGVCVMLSMYWWAVWRIWATYWWKCASLLYCPRIRPPTTAQHTSPHSISHSTAAMWTDMKKRVRWSDIFSPFRLPTLAPSLSLSPSVALFYTHVRSLAAVCALIMSLSLVLTRAWALCRVFFVKFTSSWDVYLCGCPFLRYMRLFYTYCDEAQGKAKQSKPKSKAKRSEEKRRRN